MFSDNNPEDLEKTTKMNEEPTPKPPKKPGDWVTAPMPAAKKASPQPPAQPAPPAAEASAPPPPPQPAAAPSPYKSEVVPSPSGGGFGSFLSNIGINDSNTQKWVLIGSGVAIVLCCLCVCLVFGYFFWTAS